ncbi:MAG TPA: hypothetical protein VOA87_13705 [Thermoanaerobaculia bacterium]|nr:hypothetical protein [Thermoanaerobaculia bacterium]
MLGVYTWKAIREWRGHSSGLPPRLKAVGIGFCLLLSFFLAWYDQREQTATAERSIFTLNGQLDNERGNVRNRDDVIVARDEVIAARDEQISDLGGQVVDLSSQSGSQQINREQAINNRESTITNRESQISSLQARMLDQQKLVSELQIELGKSQQPEAFRTTVLKISTPIANPKIAPNVTTLLMLTNRVVTPVHAIVFCDNAMVNVEVNVAGSGEFKDAGTSRMGPNGFQINIALPAWSPTTPLLVTIYHENDLGQCYYRAI